MGFSSARARRWLGWEVEGGKRGDDLLGFEGDGDDLADEASHLVIFLSE